MYDSALGIHAYKKNDIPMCMEQPVKKYIKTFRMVMIGTKETLADFKELFKSRKLQSTELNRCHDKLPELFFEIFLSNFLINVSISWMEN